jgi:uncharacterized protein YqjF (DUF2071 family)
MDWKDLLFLHWPVARALLQPLLPPPLEVEEHGGTAWLGVVPFRMARTRLRCLPLPGAHAFPELNVRTYVRAAGRSGVWFFSLDAHSAMAVAGARATFGLPYFTAAIQCANEGSHVTYASRRTDRRGPPARLRARWRAGGAFAEAQAGSLEHFVTERYCMFSVRRGKLGCGEIAHPPWLLAPAQVQLEECDMTRALGVAPAGAPIAHAAADQRVAAWALQRWPR